MAAFRTPLFWFFLALAGLFWYLPESRRVETVSFEAPSSGYVFIEGVLERPLAKGWALSLQRIENQPAASKLYLNGASSVMLNMAAGPGARIAGWVRPSAISVPPYPGTFDWAGYLMREGLSGAMTLDRSDDLAVLIETNSSANRLYGLRTRAVRYLSAVFPDPRIAALLGGLLIGDKRLIDRSLSEEFRAAGVMHLLVVSGMHVAAFSAFLWFIFLRVFRFSPRVACWLVLAGTWIFAAFIGLTPPVLRAAAMMSVLISAPFLRRETSGLTRLFLSGLILLAWRPSWARDSSFVLSFLSTFGVIYGWVAMRRRRSISAGWFRAAGFWMMGVAATSLFAWFALLPASAGYFHQISFIAPLSNIVLVPFSTALMVAGLAHLAALEWVPGIRDVGRVAIEEMSRLFLKCVDFFAGMPLTDVPARAWDFWLLAAWFFAMTAWGIRRPRSKGALAGAAAACLIFHWGAAWAAPKRLFLLSDGTRFEAAFLEAGRSKIYCKAASGRLSDPALEEFWRSRGLVPQSDSCDVIDPPALNYRLASFYAGAPAFSANPWVVKAACGNNVLAFPLSPFPIIHREVSSTVLECRDGEFR